MFKVDFHLTGSSVCYVAYLREYRDNSRGRRVTYVSFIIEEGIAYE
jgi:hypothetical protein